MKKSVAIILVIALSACAHPGQNDYNANDVGKPTTVEFGTILSEREVHITGNNTGGGAVVGALGGAAAGAGIGHTGLGVLVGALVGGIGGAIAEQEAQNATGIEYVIMLKNRKTITVTQYKHDDEEIFQKGAHVMVQTQGSYQRVLSAENLPEVVEKPKSVHIKKKPLPKDLEPDDDDKADNADSVPAH